MKRILHTLLALTLLAAGGTTQASLIFSATLTGAQEVPAQPNEGSGGTATFVLNDAGTALSYDVQLFGLDMSFVQANGDSTGAPSGPNTNFVTRMHIHRNIAGQNGAIVFGMIDGSATFRNDTDGDLLIDGPNLHITGVWDLTEGAGGATLATELNNLHASGLYINVHTSDHGGGEIRGQIIPEPGVLALFGIGSLGLIGFALRRRRV